jgi:hypothetical protein
LPSNSLLGVGIAMNKETNFKLLAAFMAGVIACKIGYEINWLITQNNHYKVVIERCEKDLYEQHEYYSEKLRKKD